MEVNEKEYQVSYTGTLTFPETHEQLKHNERLMLALIANDDLLTFLYNIIMPVVKLKRREAKRADKKKECTGINQVITR